jgi:branched-chain amino acid transport system ATP-binding protein
MMSDKKIAPILACCSLSKHYGALAAVDKLSFDVRSGEILGISGPNGAGKTTLFEVISGLDPATSGEISFRGHNIIDFLPEQICHMGIARTFQLNTAFDTLTARENVLLASCFGHHNLLFPGFKFNRSALKRADEALDLVRMTHKRDAVARDLPVYDRKRLMIAGALACEPKLLLLDEPVGGLDFQEINEVIELVEIIRHEHSLTIILIEHVMRFLVALSDRVMIMHQGKNIYEGLPEELAKDPKVVEVYLGEEAKHLKQLMQ